MPGDLCEELIGEIFERLPPKSLLRFRSLSKSWCSRIDSSDFIRTHTLRILKTQQKILIRYQSNGIRPDLYTLHSEGQLPLCERNGYKDMRGVECPGRNLDIVGSSNGMLCLLDSEKGITLWNPSIRRKLTLVEPPRFQKGTHVGVGFGYDPDSDDYKVVRISYFKYVESVGCGNPLVYSMKTGAWSVIASPTTPFYKIRSPAFSINGALHWLVKSYNVNKPCSNDTTDVYSSDNDMSDDEVSDDEVSHRYIMTFNLSSQVFGTVELPGPGLVTTRLTIIKGSLAVISSEGDNICIWARRHYDNTSCWSLAFIFEALQSEGRVERVYQLTNGELLFSINPDGLKVYNALSGETSWLADLRSRSYKVDMERYIESLELLDKGIACQRNQQFCVHPKKRSPKRKRSTHLSCDVMHEEVEAVFGDRTWIYGTQQTCHAQAASEDAQVQVRKRGREESRRQLAELS